MKNHDKHLVIGDFNTRFGQDCHVSHPSVIGPNCFYEDTNDNEERVANLCQEYKLIRSAQTRFRQPRSRALDLVAFAKLHSTTRSYPHQQQIGEFLEKL